jgi:hypothetical protein
MQMGDLVVIGMGMGSDYGLRLFDVGWTNIIPL